MSLKTEKAETIQNLEVLREICTEACTEEEALNLKKFYMNVYGNYMTLRIFRILFLEFLIMLFIVNTGINTLWYGIPYAETMIYGILWGSGGIYLFTMMLFVVRNTYDLKLALEAGKVKKNKYPVSFRSRMRYKKHRKNTMELYVKKSKNGKSVPIKIFTHISRHRNYGFESNAFDESSGAKLIIYSIGDNRKTVFVLSENKQITELMDKVLSDFLKDTIQSQKCKWRIWLGKKK